MTNQPETLPTPVYTLENNNTDKFHLGDTAVNSPDDINDTDIISKFTRHVVKQRSGNFPELKRRRDDALIYPTVSSNESSNRGRKLLQGSEWISRRKLNTTLYEDRVFYNGMEHKLLSRKRLKLDFADGEEQPVPLEEDSFDLNEIAKVEDILKPISSLGDIITHPSIKRSFLNDKVLNDLELQTTLMLEKAQMSSSSYSNLLNVFLGDDPLSYLCDKMDIPEYNHNLHIDESHEFIDVNKKLVELVGAEDGKTGVKHGSQEQLLESPINTSRSLSVEKSEQNADTEKDTTADIQPDAEVPNTTIAQTNNEEKISETVPEDKNSEPEDASFEDPFFAVPQYKTSTLLERMNELQSQGITIDDIENARQLTQIALQRNQEFIKNLTKIRLCLLKAERIRTRLVKWGKEYAGIPEEGVTVPNVLTVVKRGLISASTNNISKGDPEDDDEQDDRDTEEENS